MKNEVKGNLMKEDRTSPMGKIRQAFGIQTEKLVLPAIALAFILWSLTFVYRSSIVAIDGNRYFSLFDDAIDFIRNSDMIGEC